MKSRCSFILKTGLALVLCFILLVGTMAVGLAAIRDELASTGWEYPTDYDSAKIYGGFSNATNGVREWSGSWQAIDMDDGTSSDGYFIKYLYLKTNTTGNAKYSYSFRIQTFNNGSWTHDMGGTYDFYSASNSSGSNNCMYYTTNDNFDLFLDSTASGIVQCKFSCNPNASAIYVNQSPVVALNNTAPSALSAVAGTQVDIGPTNPGGSHNLAYSYEVRENNSTGTLLTTSDYIADRKFCSTVPGTYYVKTTVTDQILTDYSAVYTEQTITVSATDWYITGLEDFGGDSRKTCNKMTYNSSTGKYELDVYLKRYNDESDGKGNGKFCLRNSENKTIGPYNASGDYILKDSVAANASGYYLKAVKMDPYNTHWFNFGSKTEGDTAPTGYYTISFDPTPSNKTLQLSVNSAGMAKVYAKDGATPGEPDNVDYYNYGHIADTAITNIGGVAYAAGQSGQQINMTQTVGSDTTDSDSSLETGYVNKGTAVTVTTTIGENYRDRYYVKAFNINGKSYGVISEDTAYTNNKDTGVYTCTYTIPADLEKDYVEITPIYYMFHSHNELSSYSGANIITFYLEGYSDVVEDWGDTPYAYPYYSNYSNVANSFGAYPGQPFVFENGQYSIEIPVTNLTIDTEIVVDTTDGSISNDDPDEDDGDNIITAINTAKIKGVAVNNGWDDYFHRVLQSGWSGNENTHRQTFDADSFYKIYNEQRDSEGNSPNYIVMSLKSGGTTNNRNKYGTAIDNQDWGYSAVINKDPSDNDHTSIKETLLSTDVTTIAGENGWELYTDRYGRPIDIFGKVIGNSYSSAAEQTGSALRVISTGYSSNIAGDHSSAWLIYLPNAIASAETATDSGIYVPTGGYKLLTNDTDGDDVAEATRWGMPPSVLAIRDERNFTNGTYPSISGRTFTDHSVTSSAYSDSVEDYHTMWTALKAYANRYVYVCYESPTQRKFSDDSKGAYRYDTRWYYSFQTDSIDANIAIEYWNGREFVRESSYTTGADDKINQGAVSGCKAYFTNYGDLENSSGDRPDLQYTMSAPNILVGAGNFSFTAAAGEGYTFKGWYLDNGSSVEEIDTSLTASTAATSNATIIARFNKVIDGSLPITHSLSADSDGGLTSTTVVAEVFNGETLVATYGDGTTSSVTIPKNTYIDNSTHADWVIKVTLTTDLAEYKRLRNYNYDAFNSSNLITPEETHAINTHSSVFSFNVSDLFEDSNQTTLALAYTSYVTPTPSATYNITFTGRDNTSKTLSNIPGSPLSKAEYNLGTNSNINLTDNNDYWKTEVSKTIAANVELFMQTNQTPTITKGDGVYSTVLNVSFTTSSTSSKLTYYYPESSDADKIQIDSTGIYYSKTKSGYIEGAFNTTVSLGSIIADKDLSGLKFYAWREYDADKEEVGDIVSTQRSFNFAVTGNKTIVATYSSGAYDGEDKWEAFVDKNVVTKERTDVNSVYYNDILARFTNYKTNARVTSIEDNNKQYGVMLIYKPSLWTESGTSLNTVATDKTLIAKYIRNMNTNQIYSSGSLFIKTIRANGTQLSNLNRVNISFQTDFASFYGTKYAAVAYLKYTDSNSVVHYEISEPVFGNYD